MLSPGAQLRIYKVMVYMAVSPDGIDKDEAKVLASFADANGIDAPTRTELAGGVGKEALEAPQDDGEQAAMIAAMIEVIAADGCLDHHEQERLLTLAEDLSIPAEVVRPQLLERLMGG